MNEKTKKILSISFKVITWLLIAFTVLVVLFTMFTVLTVDKNERSIFGLGFYIVKTDSMSKSDKNANDKVHINSGDIVIVKKLSEEDKTNLQPGDIITFTSHLDGETFGQPISHKIRERIVEPDGSVKYITYGTNTGVNDKDKYGNDAKLDASFVLGKYVAKLPMAGHFFAFVKTTPGYIVCIFVPFLLLIMYNGVNVIRLYRKYRGEQNEAIEAERAQIKEERAENQRMMEELLKLKEELAKKTGEHSPPNTSSSEQNADETTESEEILDTETKFETTTDNN